MTLTGPEPAATGHRHDEAADIALRSDIAALSKRIAEAQAECDGWKAAGSQEKFLAAYFLAEALELQLEARMRQRSS